MKTATTFRRYTFKLYPNKRQTERISECLRVCCWVYNKALEQRIKSWSRRKQGPSLYDQGVLLTKWRSRIPAVKSCPQRFERSSLARVDDAMNRFFASCKTGGRVGFPRFKSQRRFSSISHDRPGKFLIGGKIRIHTVGMVKCRGKDLPADAKQIAFSILKRPSGWYAQITIEIPVPELQATGSDVTGIDLGLTKIIALADGTTIKNPRFYKESTDKLRALSRRQDRRVVGSGRFKKASKAIGKCHEKIVHQRRSFAHSLTTELVRKYRLIGVEKLNLRCMTRGRLRKSIYDASWGMFTKMLAVKAEEAGRQVIFVSASQTSQTCPDCGRIKRKDLSERVHRCPCGCVMDRDVAAAKIVLVRALEMAGVTRPWRDLMSASDNSVAGQINPKKRSGNNATISVQQLNQNPPGS